MFRFPFIYFVIYLATSFLLFACNTPQPKTTFSKNSISNNFAVASAHPLATQAGIDILQQGGNAFDAAIAVTAVLAVVEPYASGLGGGGFWLLHLAERNHNVMIDGREVAPLAATRDMYIGTDGKPTNQSVNGPLAAGIPGTPAALAHIAEKYGRLPLSMTLSAAVHLARDGFEVSELFHSRAQAVIKRLKSFPHTAEIFLHKGGAPQVGSVLRQPDLASVLESIVKHGASGFYQGEVANKLVKSVQQAGGIWQQQDLDNYKIVERPPIIGKYKNLEIVSAALPSSGGIVLMQILNMLSDYDLQAMSEVQRKHIIVEAMRRAYHTRAELLGDQDFVDIPVEELVSLEYAKKKFSDFDPQQVTPSHTYFQQDQSASEANATVEEAQNTTHFSILDQQGNHVAATLSINYYFGSGFVAKGTGVLLNNEMDDFAIQPGHANLWGLVGNEVNAIQPNKRMLSSMSPTFLFDGKRTAILGTPGGSRIISMVLLSTLAFSEAASVKEIVELPRYHHQFLPDEIQVEKGMINTHTQHSLESMGHSVNELGRQYGNMHIVIWDRESNEVTAASDPRGIGQAKVSTLAK